MSDFFFNTDLHKYPSCFITCFDVRKLEHYQEAIKTYEKVNPTHGLTIDMSGTWNVLKDPALLCHVRSDLSAFWRIFDDIADEYEFTESKEK